MVHDGMVMGAGTDDWLHRPGPMLMPIRTMIPGTTIAPGSWMVMGNVSAILTNPGFSGAYDPALGRTHPYLLNDWVMGRARTEGGHVEGMLMLNFEALTFGKGGWYEVGQAGEGLWDTQHQHQLLHKALIAVHPFGKKRDGFRATVWGGQGSAPIGPPIFMHRASNPSPTVPRKHHKGENPHETMPVIGATLSYERTHLDVAAFSAREPARDDSRLIPRPGVPNSFGARLRHEIRDGFEAQVSGERLIDQGTEGDSTQLSASVYGRHVGRVVVDVLLDGAIDIPSDHHDTPGQVAHRRAAGALFEVAVRDAALRDTLWSRVEVNQRIEPDGAVSSPWWFASLGFERLLWVDPASAFGVGPFAEATLVSVPAALESRYGDRLGVTATAGIQGHLMWMSPSTSHHR
jgi:hypothetical protein